MANLDGVVLPVQVVDADRELPGTDDLHFPGRKLLDRADGQLRHTLT